MSGVFHALEYRLWARLQRDEKPIFLERGKVLRVEDGASPRGDNKPRPLHRFTDGVFFHATKDNLAVFFKYVRDASFFSFLDTLIYIHERAACFFSQHLAYRRFAGAHESDEDEVFLRHSQKSSSCFL